MIYLLVILLIPFSLWLPWWGFAVPCFAMGLKSDGGRLKSFGIGFAAVALLWFAMAYYLNIQSHGLMAKKMSDVLPLAGFSWGVFLLTSFIGGVLGGLWCLAGRWCREVFLTGHVKSKVAES